MTWKMVFVGFCNMGKHAWLAKNPLKLGIIDRKYKVPESLVLMEQGPTACNKTLRWNPYRTPLKVPVCLARTS